MTCDLDHDLDFLEWKGMLYVNAFLVLYFYFAIK